MARTLKPMIRNPHPQEHRVGTQSDIDNYLTPMEMQILDCLADGESDSSTAARVGCSLTSVRTIRTSGRAKPYLAEKRELVVKETTMTRVRVTEMLMESYNMAKMLADPGNMIAATREVIKMHGFYEPQKININLTASEFRSSIRQMTDAELMELIENEASQPSDPS